MGAMMSSMGEAGANSGTGGSAGWMQVGGSLLSAYGQHKSGQDGNASANERLAAAQFTAAQLREKAGLAIASSQRSAEDIGRQNEYVASRALAVAASSGGGASDPTVINMIARIAGEGAYRRSIALYQGEEKSRSMNMQADAEVMSAQSGVRQAGQNARAANIGAMSTLAKSGASLFSKYGGDGPAGENTANLNSWSASQSGYMDSDYDGP